MIAIRLQEEGAAIQDLVHTALTFRLKIVQGRHLAG